MDRLGLLACVTVTIAAKDKEIPLRVCNVTGHPITSYQRRSLAEVTEEHAADKPKTTSSGHKAEYEADPVNTVTVGIPEKLSSTEIQGLTNHLGKYRCTFFHRKIKDVRWEWNIRYPYILTRQSRAFVDLF